MKYTRTEGIRDSNFPLGNEVSFGRPNHQKLAVPEDEEKLHFEMKYEPINFDGQISHISKAANMKEVHKRSR